MGFQRNRDGNRRAAVDVRSDRWGLGIPHPGRRVAVVAGPVVAAAIVIGVLAAPAGARSEVLCLTASNTVDRDCATIDAKATVSIQGDAIRVGIGSAAEWPGGPIAVEMSVPGAAVQTADGAPATQTKGYTNWTSRNGTVISRCQFDPASRPIAAGAVAECDLGLLGLKDGKHALWVTGFVGAVPNPGAEFGTVPTGQGVVAVATPRSIEFELKAGVVTLSKPTTVDVKNPPVQAKVTNPDANPIASTTALKKDSKPKSGGFPWAAAAGAAVVAVLVGGFVASKRKRETPTDSTEGKIA